MALSFLLGVVIIFVSWTGVSWVVQKALSGARKFTLVIITLLKFAVIAAVIITAIEYGIHIPSFLVGMGVMTFASFMFFAMRDSK